MTDIWEAQPPSLDRPTVGMVVKLDNGRVYCIVDVEDRGTTRVSIPLDDAIICEEVNLGTIWAVSPKPKKGGWSKSRKGWSWSCWEEMIRTHHAVIVSENALPEIRALYPDLRVA